MALILNIDTSRDIASFSLVEDGQLLAFERNDQKNDHAAWLHHAIQLTLEKINVGLGDLEAVAVSIGPGSYTGLRIGLSSAKGLCYALNIPLITVGTLEMMAFAVKDEAVEWICPMIDARRMEVFTAIYDKEMNVIKEPTAMILDEESFNEILSNHNLMFCGNGSRKLQFSHTHALFSATEANATHLGVLSTQRFLRKEFADLAYTEPLYLKDIHTAHK
jgi:tRNA threonylcarbamoyladenosine biosynthesis protein TsaB